MLSTLPRIAMFRLAALTLLPALIFALLPGALQAAAVKPDVRYVPTHEDAVHRMLEMADAGPGDRLVDLGSGDGRIVIQAVRDWGVDFATGIEIDPALVQKARSRAQAAGVADTTRFLEQDLFETDFSDASIVTMYLLESLNLKLRPVILDTLRPGTRVVSHVFGMGDWKPDAHVVARGMHAYMWVIPAQVAGQWRIETADGERFTVRFDQRYQKLEGSYRETGIDMGMSFARLKGTEIRFTAQGRHFLAEVDGNRMQGRAERGVVTSWRAERIEPEPAS